MFVERREIPKYLVNWIKSEDDLRSVVFPEGLVGGGRHRIEQMAKKQQLETITDFGQGSSNLLVATEVLEEGRDLLECNFAVRYDAKVRDMAGALSIHTNRFFEIVTRGSRSETRAKESKHKEKLLFQAVLEVSMFPRQKLLGEIQKRQLERRKVMESKTRKQGLKRKTCTEDQLKCKSCGKYACSAAEILKIEPFYVVTGGIIDSKIKIVLEQLNPKLGTIGKIYCVDCASQWGVLVQFKGGAQLPALKCENFAFDLSGQQLTPKKWKGLPIDIREGTEADIERV